MANRCDEIIRRAPWISRPSFRTRVRCLVLATAGALALLVLRAWLHLGDGRLREEGLGLTLMLGWASVARTMWGERSPSSGCDPATQ